MAANEFSGALDHLAYGVSFVVVKKKGHATVLKIVVDPAVEIPRFAAVLGDHDDAADVVGGTGQETPARDRCNAGRVLICRVRSASESVPPTCGERSI